MYIEKHTMLILKDAIEYLENPGNRYFSSEEVDEMIRVLNELLLNIRLDPNHNR